MKLVTLVVEITAEVGDEVQYDLLHLGNARTDFKIEEAGQKIEAKVTGYTTTEVYL